MSSKIILSDYIFELYYSRLTSTGNLLGVSGRRLKLIICSKINPKFDGVPAIPNCQSLQPESCLNFYRFLMDIVELQKLYITENPLSCCMQSNAITLSNPNAWAPVALMPR